MAKYSGKDLEVTYDGTAIEGYAQELNVPESQPAIETTSFGEADETYIASAVTGRKASLTALDDSTPANLHDVCVPGTSATLEWYPQGNSTGKPKKSAEAIVTDRNITYPVKDTVKLTVEFQLTGAVTESTVA